LLFLLTAPARADLVISIESTSVGQGGQGTVDILLTSTAPMNTPDQFNGYGFQLQIVNNGTDNTQLAFAANQDFGYISDAALKPSYIFLGDSAAAEPPVSPIGAPGVTVYPNDTFTGTDSTADGQSVGVATGETFLLASLTVTTDTGAPPVARDSFTISLVPTSGSGSFFDNPNTFFDTFDTDSGTETSAVPFTSASGTVSVDAVPEPAALVLGLIGVFIVGAWRFASVRWGQG
jgi:hypothetical protein